MQKALKHWLWRSFESLVPCAGKRRMILKYVNSPYHESINEENHLKVTVQSKKTINGPAVESSFSRFEVIFLKGREKRWWIHCKHRIIYRNNIILSQKVTIKWRRLWGPYTAMFLWREWSKICDWMREVRIEAERLGSGDKSNTQIGHMTYQK